MAERSWVIEVHEDINTRMAIPDSELERYRRSSIYKVPTNIKDLSTTSFEPHVVSFGPYHHGKKHLSIMEEQKQRAVTRFLSRSKKPLMSLLDSVADDLQELRNAYYPLDQSWKDDNRKFLQVMITDGCFMAEILITAKYGFDGYAHDDPVFSKHGKLHIMPFIARDMLMLENQLPMPLLRKLCAFLGNESEEEESATIYELMISFFPKLKFLKPVSEDCENTSDVSRNSLHILDVFRKSLLEPPKTKQSFCRSLHLLKDRFSNSLCFHKEADPTGMVRSAAELQEAGIQFRKSQTTSLKDISFSDGILMLPQIILDDISEPTIRNLLAMECLQVEAGNEITSYVSFMERLIDTEKDAAILRANGIIINNFGSDKAVAKLFCSLSKDIAGSFHDVEGKVNCYCRKPYHRWRANLARTYFKSPWSLISLVAAILLFTLTAIQTFYSAYQYYHKK